ncbi:MAG: hypothetical protein SGJ09_15645, partial [Phycisphaerae bacterium]|nr:hypothetical protein [Phycisphaerae bacterium]
GAVCICTGDLNQSGSVDAADLSILLGQWGGNASADFNSDGIVNAADLSVLLGAWGPCPSAPANDHCANAQLITPGFIQVCNIGADTDGPTIPASGGCNVNGYTQIGSDVWFEFVSQGDGTLSVSTCNNGWDTKIAIYGSTIPGLSACPVGISFATFLGCSDDVAGCDFGSQVTIQVNEGEHYKIRVGGFQGIQGDGLMGVFYTPDGADCQHAIKIYNPVSGTVTGTNLDKPLGSDLANCVNGEGASTWYFFESPCIIPNSELTISLCHPGTNFDTVLTVWRIGEHGECAQVLIDCNDDYSGSGCQISGFNRKSKVSFTAQPGWTYYVQVSGFLGAKGDYEMTVTLDWCS